VQTREHRLRAGGASGVVICHQDERAITGTIVITAAATGVPSSVGVFPTF
jgi:hypothetical protein